MFSYPNSSSLIFKRPKPSWIHWHFILRHNITCLVHNFIKMSLILNLQQIWNIPWGIQCHLCKLEQGTHVHHQVVISSPRITFNCNLDNWFVASHGMKWHSWVSFNLAYVMTRRIYIAWVMVDPSMLHEAIVQVVWCDNFFECCQ